MYLIALLALVGAAIAAPNALAPRIVKESATGALDQRIVGGSDANIEDYPFMAVILASGDEGTLINFMPICGGSLITSRAVLSAAHCFLNNILEPYRFRVRLGSSLKSVGGHLHRVENWLTHPGYVAPMLYHDIGILKLATPAIFSNRVAVAHIAGINYSIPDNTTITATGWGQLEDGGHPSEILQQVDIEKINHDICRENYAEVQSVLGERLIPNITSGMICAGILGVGGKDACGGDSGGPLLHQGVVIGVTSWGYGCAHPKYPGVFVNVPSYTNWIVDNA